MEALIKRLEDFHNKFNIPVGQYVGDTTKGQQDLHYTLMLEELNEFKDASDKGDIVEVADGLGDVLFVLISSVVAHGLQGCFVEVFNEICDSNESKLDGNGNVIYRHDGKILKGENYFRPRIKEIIDRHAAKAEEMALLKSQIKNE